MSTLHTDTLVTTVQPVDGSEPNIVENEIKPNEDVKQPADATATEELITIEPVAPALPNVSTTTVIEAPNAVSKSQTTEKNAKREEPVTTKNIKTTSPEAETKVDAKVESTAPKANAVESIVAVSESDNRTSSDAKTQSVEDAEVLVLKDSHHQNSVSATQDNQVATTVASADKPVHSDTTMAFNTDWILIAVFILTSIIVLITNRKAIKRATALAKESSRPVMPTINPAIDVDFEKAKIVAESRQQWIQSLRAEIADFVSATNAIWDLHKIKDGFEDILTEMKDPQFAMKELHQWSCTYNKALQDTEKLYAKIHLLINPDEEHSQTLSSLLDKTMVAIEAKKSPSKLNDEIVAITQVILKQEWQRVKTFS
ncbi:hypothetical protein O4H50_07290 [Vibrio diazotrophicus]|uniref:hypothetical protein n=1 Tax=Vibrio diazotrophicus TaxID=685 RepID=UPI0022AEB3C3|nr:hypothetical protein [Vibrio diazotrophicus]MCZ4371588.1 hypothetical protein [Vibrio diazotrophicus]